MKTKRWTSPHGTPLPVVGERTLIMGVLNTTPDSFSDGGAWIEVGVAVQHAHQMVADGADIIDVGGESTRPGAEPVSAAEELARVVPIIRRLKRELPQLPLSIDTYKAEVADAAIAAGADMINDVWGLKHGMDEAGPRGEALPTSPMAEVAAKRGCPVILMHNRTSRSYSDFWGEILENIHSSLALARAAGVEDRQIWLDPGFGFGKEPPHNLEVLKHLDRIVSLGFPVLLGTSRKSTIGLVLDRPVEQRLEGTAAANVWGIARGCHMIRVHDVAPMHLFAKMADAINQGINYRHG